MVELTEAEAFWEDRYAGFDRVWSGHVNRVLADVASTIEPGAALDLGCGEGGDAIWLAQQGWEATGVDLSPNAIARAQAAAVNAGVLSERLHLFAADLATWASEPKYDLVAASFLQSWPVDIPREEILRRATQFVAPGGSLLIVAHASGTQTPAHDHAPERKFPTPEEDLAALHLDLSRWNVRTVETRERLGTRPDGTSMTFCDAIVLVQRRI